MARDPKKTSRTEGAIGTVFVFYKCKNPGFIAGRQATFGA